jgi:hypothetical protein
MLKIKEKFAIYNYFRSFLLIKSNIKVNPYVNCFKIINLKVKIMNFAKTATNLF